MLQVLLNLLSNSIKHNPPGGYITIAVSDDKLDSDDGLDVMNTIRIDVIDEGKGIPESELESIFDKFAQSSRTSKKSGTGLGLSICYEIIKLHSGVIKASNMHSTGTMFTIFIPRE